LEIILAMTTTAPSDQATRSNLTWFELESKLYLFHRTQIFERRNCSTYVFFIFLI